jgi:polysaccharide biosynthesis protein PslH
LPNLDTLSHPIARDTRGSGDSLPQHGPLHVAVVDEGFPYPPNSGKRIRSLNLILPLAKRHHITYIAYRHADPDETRRAVDFLNAHGIETVVVDRFVPHASGLAFYGRLVLNLLSPLPYSVQVHDSAALRRAIRHYAATQRVDLWHAEWTPYHEPLCRTVRGPWVVMAHNVESLIWQRYSETESNAVKRWYIKRQWHKFVRFERRVLSQAAQTVTVSDADAVLARERFGASRVSVVDNGVDVAAFRTDGSLRDPRHILFLGSLDWRPNLDAVQILLDRVFPEVLAQEPAAQLVLVGRKPPSWLIDRVRDCSNVQLHADVPDVRPFLWECGIMVVPLRIGGGSRLKILEALAAECPVVSTKVGAEGLHLVHGRHFVQVDTIDDVVTALLRCIADPRPLQEMAILGRQVVADRYDWPMLSTKLEAVWLTQARVGRLGR